MKTLLPVILFLVVCSMSAPGANAPAAPVKSAAPPPPATTNAHPDEIVFVRSVFEDNPDVGKDPFFPDSPRRRLLRAKANDKQLVLSPGERVFGQLFLKGVSGSVDRRLALINGYTFQAGETVEMRVGGQTHKIRCLEIRETAAVIVLEETNERRELHLRAGAN